MKLPTRQQEIMLLICDGFRDKEIAYKLGISIYTVRHHYAQGDSPESAVHALLERLEKELAARLTKLSAATVVR